MKHIGFLFFLFFQSVWAYEGQRDFVKISDEKNPKSYVVIYKRPNGSCFLNPGIYQSWHQKNDLIELLNKEDLCKFSFSEEERIIRGIAENANASQSVVGIMKGTDGNYFLIPVEIIPVQGFKPAGTVIAVFAGGAVFTLPPGWVALVGVGAAVGGQQLYANRESILKQARRTIEAGKVLLALNRELSLFKPLESFMEDIADRLLQNNHLIVLDDFPGDGRDSDFDEDFNEEDIHDHLWDRWGQKTYKDIFEVLKEAREEALGEKELTREELSQVREESIQAKKQLDALALVEESLSGDKQIASELEKELSEEQKDILRQLRLLWEAPYVTESLDNLSSEDRQRLEELHKLWAEHWVKNPVYVDEEHNRIYGEFSEAVNARIEAEEKGQNGPRSLTPREESQVEKHLLVHVLKTLGKEVK